MRGNRVMWSLVVLLLASTLGAQEPKKAPQAFEKLKTLVGEWEGTHGSGERGTASYRLTSGGSVLTEILKGGQDEMLTTYYLDGDRLMMTHYCGAGNQPRMRTEGLAADGSSIAFRFQDATNLSSPEAGHMHALDITFVDADHFTQQWTWREGGKDDVHDVFHMTRKK